MKDREYIETVCSLVKTGQHEQAVNLQYEYMNKVLKGFEPTPDSSVEAKMAYDLLHYAVHTSQSGSSIVSLSDYDLGDRDRQEVIDNIENGAIYSLIGEYLLDEQDYEEDEDYIIDVMFAGVYVPDWDGWDE